MAGEGSGGGGDVRAMHFRRGRCCCRGIDRSARRIVHTNFLRRAVRRARSGEKRRNYTPSIVQVSCIGRAKKSRYESSEEKPRRDERKQTARRGTRSFCCSRFVARLPTFSRLASLSRKCARSSSDNLIQARRQENAGQ